VKPNRPKAEPTPTPPCIQLLNFARPIRRPVSRLPARPDQVPVITSSIRVGIRVTWRNRQHFNSWNTRVRGAHDSVYKEIINLGHFLTIGALYFDLAAKMVVSWKRFGPDHAEMIFAIRTHERLVAWHWRTPASWIEVQAGEAGAAVYLFLFDKSMTSFTVQTTTQAAIRIFLSRLVSSPSQSPQPHQAFYRYAGQDSARQCATSNAYLRPLHT
jgi:hypothetical protein